jgi:hypothetical protein
MYHKYHVASPKQRDISRFNICALDQQGGNSQTTRSEYCTEYSKLKEIRERIQPSGFVKCFKTMEICQAPEAKHLTV